MYPISTYEKATTIQEAIQLLEANPRSRLIAGGTDVLIRLHKGKKGFDHLVDIHDLDEIKEIAIDPSGTITIGAGVSFSSIMNSEIVLKHIPILAQAVATIGGPQIRNMATIGGNLCNGVPSADSAPSLYALNAIMHMTGCHAGRHGHCYHRMRRFVPMPSESNGRFAPGLWSRRADTTALSHSRNLGWQKITDQ